MKRMFWLMVCLMMFLPGFVQADVTPLAYYEKDIYPTLEVSGWNFVRQYDTWFYEFEGTDNPNIKVICYCSPEGLVRWDWYELHTPTTSHVSDVTRVEYNDNRPWPDKRTYDVYLEEDGTYRIHWGWMQVDLGSPCEQEPYPMTDRLSEFATMYPGAGEAWLGGAEVRFEQRVLGEELLQQNAGDMPLVFVPPGDKN